MQATKKKGLQKINKIKKTKLKNIEEADNHATAQCLMKNENIIQVRYLYEAWGRVLKRTSGSQSLQPDME